MPVNGCFDYHPYLTGGPLNNVVGLLHPSVLLDRGNMANLLITLCLVTCLTVPIAPNRDAVTQGDRETVLQSLAAVFGPPIDLQNGLFEVNRFFLVEVKFDAYGRLTQLGVLPKHWFSEAHPEWQAVEDAGELSALEYKTLLNKLEGVRRKGKLVKRAKYPIVTNATARIHDGYERAVLETGDIVDARRSEDAPRAIKYFIIYFTATRQTK
jgi:hypothetical protein